MSSFCIYSHFSSKNISVYAIFNDQSFNDMLINDILSFEQLSPGIFILNYSSKHPAGVVFSQKLATELWIKINKSCHTLFIWITSV